MTISEYFSDAEKMAIEAKNCQNLVGGVVVPVGLAGPVPVEISERGADARSQLELSLPLATTEGALVPSINRGCKAIREAGGAMALVEQRGMSRAPVFRCSNGRAAVAFLEWVLQQEEILAKAAGEVSGHLTLIKIDGWVEGRLVFVRCTFDPNQAMGMNMVTIATQKAWDILKEKLVKQFPEWDVELVALSGNLCSDKKQSAVNRLLGRGWWVQVEVFLPEEVVQKVLKTTSKKMVELHSAKNLVGSYLAGDAAQNMHIANAAAALLIATGQDAAHVVDIAQGMTTCELTDTGLYMAVTLPTVPVGVVGGGTWLPSQQQSLRRVKHGQLPTAAELATAMGVAALAGEVSGIAALSTHDLAKAHQRLGRGAA